MTVKIPNSKANGVVLKSHEVNLFEEGGLKIVGALMSNPATTKQLALRLNMNRARVQYVIDRLIKRGVLSLYKEVHEANQIERYYIASASDVILVLEDDSEYHMQFKVANIILDSLQTSLIDSLSHITPSRATLLRLVQCRLRPEQVKAFKKRLEALAQEFNDVEDERAEDSFSLALALYPVISDPLSTIYGENNV